MEDLNFRPLDEQIALIEERFLQFAEERRVWESDRRKYEERLRDFQGELEKLRGAGERLSTLEGENEKYREGQELVRHQVTRMLERIRSVEK